MPKTEPREYDWPPRRRPRNPNVIDGDQDDSLQRWVKPHGALFVGARERERAARRLNKNVIYTEQDDRQRPRPSPKPRPRFDRSAYHSSGVIYYQSRQRRGVGLGRLLMWTFLVFAMLLLLAALLVSAVPDADRPPVSGAGKLAAIAQARS
jgi:hypothetical protein